MTILLVGCEVTVDDRVLVDVVVLHDHHLDTVTNVRQIEIQLAANSLTGIMLAVKRIQDKEQFDSGLCFVTSFDSDRQNLSCSGLIAVEVDTPFPNIFQ